MAQQCHPQPGRGLVEEQTPDASTHAPPADKHREQPVFVPTHTRQVGTGWSAGTVLGHIRVHASGPLLQGTVQHMLKAAQLLHAECAMQPAGLQAHFLPMRSEKTPPIGRAMKLRVPKMAARLPALVTLKLKLLPR